MKIEEVFAGAENGALTLEQFKAKAGEAKFVDLSEGAYVSKKKYEDDLASKAKEVETLNTTIATRDKDLGELKVKLQEAGNDAEKLNTLNGQLTDMQKKYDEDAKNWKAQLSKQAYEFAVKEYAGKLKFTSEAAKREFIHNMIDANLKMDKNGIMGADDFKKTYTETNADSFVVENPAPEPNPAPKQVPQFVGATPGEPGNGPKMSLTEMMKAKNENPNLSINF